MYNDDNTNFSEIFTKQDILQKQNQKSSVFIADNFSTNDFEDILQKLPPDLEGWIKLYIKLQVEGIKSEQTLKAICSDLQKFTTFFNQYHYSQDIRQWLPRTSKRFIESLEQIGQKPHTIKRTFTSLNAFARWVFSQRPDFFPLGNPTKGIKHPIQQPLKPKSLTEQQVKRLLDAAYHLICQTYPDETITKKESWYSKGHRQMRRPLRDYAILMLLLNGGLRCSEVCNLNLSQLQGRYLKNIKCKGNLFRDILIGEETLSAIETYLTKERIRDADAFQPSQALFLPSLSRKHRNINGRIASRSIRFIVNQIADTANQGLPSEKHIKVHPHMFRHTHAYQILKKGRSLPYLQKRLGHQSMNYLALYTQMPEKEEQKLLDDAEFK